MLRPDLPPWLYPPPRMPRFAFNSGPLAFVAGVEQFVGRIATAPGLWLRLALFGTSQLLVRPETRLRLSGPGCADWSSVLLWPTSGSPPPPVEMPIFLILPRDTQADVFLTDPNAVQSPTIVRLLGWHFDPIDR